MKGEKKNPKRRGVKHGRQMEVKGSEGGFPAGGEGGEGAVFSALLHKGCFWAQGDNLLSQMCVCGHGGMRGGGGEHQQS